MRTTLLILATLLLLGGAFAFYWRAQPAVVLQGPDGGHAAIAPVSTQPADSFKGYRAGTRAWITMTNAQGGRSSQFRAAQYLPQKDGTVHLISPEADFFLGNNQRLHVIGTDGTVVMKSAPDMGSALGSAVSPTGPPNRGRLEHVKMTLVNDAAVDPAKAVSLTLETNNIEFDNESFLITTGGYIDENGRNVPPDQVPVKVRGDYYLDGRGLTLRWNDRDDRLELLELAHGDELRIEHPSSKEHAAPRSAPPPSDAPPSAPPPSAPQATPASPNSTPPASKPTGKPKKTREDRPAYLATFQDNVHITQGEQSLITSDLMRVHFRPKPDEQESTPPAAPDSTPPPLASSVTATPPASSPPASPPPDGSNPAVATPTTAPVPQETPIVITWTGKLRIVPAPPNMPREVGPGQTVVELDGVAHPVFVRRAAEEDSPASEVHCTTLTYAKSDGSIWMAGSPAFGPVQLLRLANALTDEGPAAPVSVTTDSLHYDGTQHKAVLHGLGHAIFPVDAADPVHGNLDATWSQQAQIALAPGVGEQLVLRAAVLDGDVHVIHPQMDLKSQELTLHFAPIAGHQRTAQEEKSELSEAFASQDVHVRMTDAQGKPQIVDCDTLDLHTAHAPLGGLYAQKIDATGQQVHASDGTEDLYADVVHMTLRPSAKPATRPAGEEEGGLASSSGELDTMDASDNVRVVSKDGSQAASDKLHVQMENDQPHVILNGIQSLVKVTDARKNILSGPTIEMWPNQQLAHVVGAGTLDAISEPPPGSAARGRTIKVLWAQGADLFGADNYIDLRGNVQATMPDADGMIDNAQCETMRIDLVPRPATPAAPGRHHAVPTNNGQMGLLHDKQPSLITMTENAIVQSNSTAADGRVLRQFVLKAPIIKYALSATRTMAAHSLLVPTAGVMLVRDHRPPEQTEGNGDQQGGLSSNRGATAFKWSRRLVYSEDARRAIMSGDVLVVHQSDVPKELPVQLAGDEMTAYFEPAKITTGTTQSSEPPELNLQRLEAIGNAIATRGPAQLNAEKMIYEPATHWMTAIGSSSVPVVMLNEDGTQTTADEARWNTDTWNFVAIGANGQSRR